MQHIPSITFNYLSVPSLHTVCLPPHPCLWPSLTGFSKDFRWLLSFSSHLSIVPFFSFPKNCFFISSLFILLSPQTLHAFPHSILSLFSLKSPLSSVQLLPSHPPSFPAPVEYYRMFSPLPPTLSSLRSFSLSKISPWYPSFIPPYFSRPAVLYSFFSLAAHSRFLLGFSFHSHLW